MAANLIYRTDAIADYFGTNRRRWDEFYPSERWMIERMAERRNGTLGNVLDVGCACGGLGAALSARRLIRNYAGIDINAQAIARAKSLSDIGVPHRFVEGDISRITTIGGPFDTVFNLSCADWNVDTKTIIAETWRQVVPGGLMIISLRLTEKTSSRGLEQSFQYIHFGDPAALPETAERAAYVVLNAAEALEILGSLAPLRVTGYGYWGKPSAMARTPFERLAFTVFAVEKEAAARASPPVLELHLPWDLWRIPA